MRLTALVIVAAALASPAGAEEGKRPPIGTVLPDFAGRDVEGKEFRLSAVRVATKEAALAAVLAAARPGAAPSDAVDALPRVLDAFGTPDPERRVAFVRQAAKPWGLLPTAKATASLGTLDDVAAWIARASEAPIVFVIWSPKCPYVRGYDDRLQAVVAETGARLYAVSANKPVTDDDIRAYVRLHDTPYRVLVDRAQEICDLLGGRNTPEAIVVDRKGALRYRGGIDDDPLETKEAPERAQWLRDALVAVRDGKEVARPTTTATGCVVRRK
jgi:hypothetical protein